MVVRSVSVFDILFSTRDSSPWISQSAGTEIIDAECNRRSIKAIWVCPLNRCFNLIPD